MRARVHFCIALQNTLGWGGLLKNYKSESENAVDFYIYSYDRTSTYENTESVLRSLDFMPINFEATLSMKKEIRKLEHKEMPHRRKVTPPPFLIPPI